MNTSNSCTRGLGVFAYFAINLILSCIYEINKKFKKAYGTMDCSVDCGGYGHCRDCFRESAEFRENSRGERLARIERSPNYRDGAFRNIHETPLMTSDKGRLQGLLDFVFKDKTGLQPDSALTVVKTDLRQINPEEDVLVWFGHSSYLVQVDGKRVLVDPVFCMASPVFFY